MNKAKSINYNAIPNFDYKLPEDIANIRLPYGFYVKINNYYTATVRNLKDFVDYLKRQGDIDFDVFGQIKNEDDSAPSGFISHLYQIIGQIKGFAHFNPYRHQFIECQDDNETISIKTKSGKRITVSVMENASCVDIKYHDSPSPTVNNGMHDLEQFKIIGFNCGSTPVPTSDVTLMTILLDK